MKSRRKTFLILLGLLVFVAVVAEMAARSMSRGAESPPLSHQATRAFFANPETADYDRTLGFRVRPGLNLQVQSPDPFRVRTNSKGFRDDEDSLTQAEFLFLGDSFVFGWGVEESEGMVSVFEETTGRSALNMGVPGYGTVQESLLIDETSDSITSGSPTVVLMVSRNDFPGNVRPVYSAFPTLRKKDLRLVITSPVEKCYRIIQDSLDPPLGKSLADRFALTQLAYASVFPSTPEAIPDASAPISVTFEEHGSPLNRTETLEFTLRYLKMVLEESGFPLYSVYIPSRLELNREEHPYSRDFEAIMRMLRIPRLDLANILEASDYLDSNGHLNKQGHIKAAKAIGEFLRGEGALKEPAAEMESTSVSLQNGQATGVVTPPE